MASPSRTSPVMRRLFGAIRPTAEPASTMAAGSTIPRSVGVSPPPHTAPACRQPSANPSTRLCARCPVGEPAGIARPRRAWRRTPAARRRSRGRSRWWPRYRCRSRDRSTGPSPPGRRRPRGSWCPAPPRRARDSGRRPRSGRRSRRAPPRARASRAPPARRAVVRAACWQARLNASSCSYRTPESS